MARGRKPLSIDVKIARLEQQLAELKKQKETSVVEEKL
jgi:hypothetical protein